MGRYNCKSTYLFIAFLRHVLYQRNITKVVKDYLSAHTGPKVRLPWLFFNIIPDTIFKTRIVPQFLLCRRLDLADQAFKEFTKRGQVKHQQRNIRAQSKNKTAMILAVVNIQKFKDNSEYDWPLWLSPIVKISTLSMKPTVLIMNRRKFPTYQISIRQILRPLRFALTGTY